MNKEKKYISNILVLIAIAISFKISALLVCFPIIIYLFYSYRKELQNISLDKVLKSFSIPLIISIIFLFSIFFYRYFLVENPFFPLFSRYFNPGDQQLFEWEQFLRGYDRTGFFPFWIFIPESVGKISFVLGPANLLLIITSIIYYLRNLKFNNPILTVGIFQFILLLLFSQGRADYYMSPLILVTCGLPTFTIKEFKSLTNKFKKILRSFIVLIVFLQLLMFLVSSLYSIFLNLYIIYDYQSGMDKTAYNFYNSRIIEENTEGPVMSEITGMTHLYTKRPFIANQKFNRCFYYDKDIDINQKYKVCMKREGVKTIIVEKDKLKNNAFFACKTHNLLRVSRNIFLEKKLEADFCKLK